MTYDADAPELTDAKLAEFRPAREVHGQEELSALMSVRGRPGAAARKVPVTIRLDARVVDAFKAAAPGCQTRINAALLAGPETEAAAEVGMRPDRATRRTVQDASGPLARRR